MQTGLDKLIEASESVTSLSKELVVKEKDLAIASAKADEVGLRRNAFSSGDRDRDRIHDLSQLLMVAVKRLLFVCQQF